MLLALVAGAAHAASCCAVATSSLPDVLDSCDGVGVGLSLGGTHRLGVWNRTGDWSPGGSLRRESLTSSVSGLARLTDQLQAAVAIPLTWERTQAGTIDEAALGPGDARAGVRLDGPPPGAHGLAAWRPALAVALVAPSSEETSRWTAEGEAQWDRPHARGRWFMAGGAAVEDDGTLARTSASVAGTLDIGSVTSLHAGVSSTDAPPRGARRSEAALGLVLRPTRTWRLTTTVRAPLPFYGRNDAGDLGVALSLLRTWAVDGGT